MDVGLFAMPLHPPGSNVTETLENDLDMLITLEKLGYSEAWIGEHFTTQWENIPAPDIFIAHALAKTERMKFGTGVTCMPNHNPFMIAHRIAQLDHMAKGRFMWGVGSGGFPGDFEVFGFRSERRANDPPGHDARGHRNRAHALAGARGWIPMSINLVPTRVIQTHWESVEEGARGGPKAGALPNGCTSCRRCAFWDFNIPEPDDLIGLLLVHMEPYQKPHPPIGVACGPECRRTRGHADAGRLARGMDSDEHQPGADARDPDALGVWWPRRARDHRRRAERPTASQWRIAREVYSGSPRPPRRKGTQGSAGRDAGLGSRDFRHYFLHIMPKVRMLDAMKIDPDMPDSDVTGASREYLVDNVFIVGSPGRRHRQACRSSPTT